MDLSRGLYVPKIMDSVKISDLLKIFTRFQVPAFVGEFLRQPHIAVVTLQTKVPRTRYRPKKFFP